jgi:homocysteine S-methyltransferase
VVGATTGRCSAVGLNCCAPDDVLAAIGITRATDKLDKPVIVYPNIAGIATLAALGR